MPGSGRPQKQGGEGMTCRGIYLTDREMDVLRLTAAGNGARAIARLLNIRIDRVKRLKQSIKANFDLGPNTDTRAMLARARKLGFIN